MQIIGVAAVVEGLSAFTSKMDIIKSSIEMIQPPASMLQNAFGMLGDAAGNFASFVAGVLAYTLGGLLTDAIQGVVSMLGELIDKTIEAGSEFQTLELRLNGMNLDALSKSGVDYNTAMTESVELTKEQLSWLQKLAAATPFDNSDISRIYTLARGYGFSDEAARSLTESTADFTSAMGLTGVEMERVIVNLGQMRARGKITATEMRDLARGAFLPLDDVLGRVAKSMGITVSALTKQISLPGEGVPAQLFIDAFEEMVALEPRFIGASERMARTFKAASANVMDLATSFGGLNIVMPILDVLGGRVADFMDQFIRSDEAGQTFTALGERLLKGAESIGQSLSDIVSSVLGLVGGNSGDLAEGLVKGVEFVRDWLTTNSGPIIAKVGEIKQAFIDFATSDFVTGLIENFGLLYDQLFKVNEETGTAGWQDLLGALGDIGTAIAEIILPYFTQYGDKLGDTEFNVQDFVKALHSISDWIRENKTLIEWLIIAFIAFQVVQTTTNLFFGFIITLLTATGGLVTLAAAATIMLLIMAVVIVIIGAVIAIFKLFQIMFNNVRIGIQFGIALIQGYFKNMEFTITQILLNVIDAWKRGDWGGIGWGIVSGIASGITNGASIVTDAAKNAAWAAFQGAKGILGIYSPSTVFAGMGENIMLGMAKGISESAGLAVAAMEGAVSAMSMPALSAPSLMQSYSQAAPSAISNTYQSSNAYNLQINSSASTEPIIQDFNMLKSMAGA